MILNPDRTLPKPKLHIEDDFLCLDEFDYTPIEIGWGYCLLGFFTGRFPGKFEVEQLTLRWSRPSKISHHPNGWIVFHFKTEEDMLAIFERKHYKATRVSLIMCPMPKDFRFDTTIEVKYRV